MLVQYTFMYNTLGIGRELYRSVVFAYVVVIKLPLRWSILFFKNRLYDLGWCAGIRSDREFRGYNMYRIICGRATLLYIAWFSHYNTIFWHHSDINQIPFWYQFDITLISFLYIKSIFNEIQPQQLITPPFPIPYIRILKRITLIYS